MAAPELSCVGACCILLGAGWRARDRREKRRGGGTATRRWGTVCVRMLWTACVVSLRLLCSRCSSKPPKCPCAREHTRAERRQQQQQQQGACRGRGNALVGLPWRWPCGEQGGAAAREQPCRQPTAAGAGQRACGAGEGARCTRQGTGCCRDAAPRHLCAQMASSGVPRPATSRRPSSQPGARLVPVLPARSSAHPRLRPPCDHLTLAGPRALLRSLWHTDAGTTTHRPREVGLWALACAQTQTGLARGAQGRFSSTASNEGHSFAASSGAQPKHWVNANKRVLGPPPPRHAAQV